MTKIKVLGIILFLFSLLPITATNQPPRKIQYAQGAAEFEDYVTKFVKSINNERVKCEGKQLLIFQKPNDLVNLFHTLGIMYLLIHGGFLLFEHDSFMNLLGASMLIGSILWLYLVAKTFDTIGPNPYIVMDENGLSLEKRHIFEWADIDKILMRTFFIHYDFGSIVEKNALTVSDKYGNILLSAGGHNRLPVSLENLKVVLEHYWAFFTEQKIQENPQ